MLDYPGLDKNYRIIEFKNRYNQANLAFSNTLWFWVLNPFCSDCDCCLQLTKDNNKPFIRQAYWFLLEDIKNVDENTIRDSKFRCCDHCLASLEFDGINMHKIALAKKMRGVP